MRFDAIVVPRGAEASAVESGWPAPRPSLVIVPAGRAAGYGLAAPALAKTALVLGLCGALDPALRVGDTVVYGHVRDGEDRIQLDADLAAECAVLFSSTLVDAAVVERVIGDVAEKSALRAATGASVIDMEAGSIAAAFHARSVRVVMVRVVSDDALAELPDLSSVYDPAGAIRPFALASALLRKPLRSVLFIVRVLKALQSLRRTARRLSRGADR